MKDLSNLIQKYTIKQDWKIKKICQPLQLLGISVFGYYKIKKSGEFFTLSNYPQESEYYYSGDLYLSNPYLKDPHMFRSGYAITTSSFDPQSLDLIQRRFFLRNLFIILNRQGEDVEGFIFATKTHDSRDMERYFSLIHALHNFSSYFLRETKGIFKKMSMDAVNLKKLEGNAFFERDPSVPLLSIDSKMEQFLNKVTSLSVREKECLELYKKGHSSRTTAALLGLSPRTVETYFDHIKQKLGCHSKSELLKM